jgi:hypothetical protein
MKNIRRNTRGDCVNAECSCHYPAHGSFFDLQTRPPSGSEPAPNPDDVAEAAARLYIQAHRLVAFIDMNREGFRKVLKKHDKLTDVALSIEHLPAINRSLPASDAAFVQKACPDPLPIV